LANKESAQGRLARCLSRRRAFGLFIFLVFLFVPAQQQVAHAEVKNHSCAGIELRIDGANEKEAELICRGTKGAIDFLRKCEMGFEGQLFFDVVSQDSEKCEANSYAAFDVRSRKIILANLETCSRMFNHSRFSKSVNVEDYFSSIVAHEVTHPIIDPVLGDVPHRQLVHEYAAYTAQFSQLSPQILAEINAGSKTLRHVALSDLSAVIYHMAPETFGMMAFSHFLGPDGGCQTLASLLTGKRRLSQGFRDE